MKVSDCQRPGSAAQIKYQVASQAALCSCLQALRGWQNLWEIMIAAGICDLQCTSM